MHARHASRARGPCLQWCVFNEAYSMRRIQWDAFNGATNQGSNWLPLSLAHANAGRRARAVQADHYMGGSSAVPWEAWLCCEAGSVAADWPWLPLDWVQAKGNKRALSCHSAVGLDGRPLSYPRNKCFRPNGDVRQFRFSTAGNATERTIEGFSGCYKEMPLTAALATHGQHHRQLLANVFEQRNV